MRDVASGRTILSVFVPFAPLPTSGFVLLVAEDDVVDLGWTVNETMQGIVSGGLSMPASVRFAPAAQGLGGVGVGRKLGLSDVEAVAVGDDDDRERARRGRCEVDRPVHLAGRVCPDADAVEADRDLHRALRG